MARMPRAFVHSAGLLIMTCGGGCATTHPVQTAWTQYIGPGAPWRHLDAPLSPELFWHSSGKIIHGARGRNDPDGHYGDR